MHPAIGLLIYVVIAVHIALPLGTWLLLSGRRNDTTRLWFISISVYSLSICAIALRPLISDHLANIVAWSGACASWLLMIETLRRELNKAPWRWPYIATCVSAWAGLMFWLRESGSASATGVLTYSIVFVCLNLTLSYFVWQLRRRYQSRSLMLVQVAFAIHAMAYLNRLYQYAMSGNVEYLNVFSFSWVSNLVTLSSILAMILICFGYWGFSLEKSIAETKHAQKGQLQAQSESDAMRALVKERDQLLMLNARVSALSSLSSFSAMLVHDISQPLQALELGLFSLQSQAVPSSEMPQLPNQIEELIVLSGKASDMVSSLRRLMIRGQDQMDDVDLRKAMDAVFPILQGEARQRSIALDLSIQLDTQTMVQANEVMLQRIVFNLVANAMDALAGMRMAPGTLAHIEMALFQETKNGQAWVVLQIQDNGPGMPDELRQQLAGPVVSHKAQGSGLGLLLTQSMLRLWGGHTVVDNLPAQQGTGACVQLWLLPAQTGLQADT
jgi:signal transduction histidine kinase